jgi:radical SAM protein with 4Fe4S-binding SPASM domain
MGYKPVTGVWELTMACNMRCKHCGSSCSHALPDELTTEEAFDVCDQLGEMGLSWVTLSGGEPLLKKDWPLIAKRLLDNKVVPTMITNGWLFNEEIADTAIDSGVDTIAISVDGLKKTHDYIRREGSFQRIMKAYEIMKGRKITSAAITTINKMNIGELPYLKDVLVEKGVQTWQVQIGIPMGNQRDNAEMLVEPHEVDTIIDFAYDMKDDERIRICLADCMGYNNLKETAVRRKTSDVKEGFEWNGCHAGKYSLGILHNGDLVGCTSIRDRKFIEGNLKERPLKEIWESKESFNWNRNMKKDQLKGFCGQCQYGDSCLGGCPNTRLTFEGSVYGENPYCSYNVSMNRVRRSVKTIDDTELLWKRVNHFVGKKLFQMAEMHLSKFIEINGENIENLNMAGFIHYALTNYHKAKNANEKVIQMDAMNAYGHKGLGLTLVKLDEVELGIQHLKKAIEFAEDDFLDPYHDLAVTFLELGRRNEAIETIEAGRRRSEKFIEMSDTLFSQICQEPENPPPKKARILIDRGISLLGVKS